METTTPRTFSDRRRRYRRITVWSMLLIVFMAMLLPLGSYVYVGLQDAKAQAVNETNPRANYWRAVREGNMGYTAVRGQETGVLIQNGQNWRQLRNGLVANYGGWFLFIVLILIMLYFAKKGSIPIEGGKSGIKVRRWSPLERLLHWYTAILFIILTITGLSMLFGRAVLIPLMGLKGFAAWAGIAMGLHNNLGPWFAGGVVLMIVLWMRHNIPNATDIKWLTSGGGMVGNAHPSAGFANGGEKVWFWIICTFGVAVIVSGLILDFPNWGTTRGNMQLANLIHGVCGLVWVAVWFGHAYIGTIGSEGSIEAMTTGYVDEAWARQHHDLWLAEVQEQGSDSASTRQDTAPRGSPA